MWMRRNQERIDVIIMDVQLTEETNALELGDPARVLRMAQALLRFNRLRRQYLNPTLLPATRMEALQECLALKHFFDQYDVVLVPDGASHLSARMRTSPNSLS
jgi:hypothetical protein